MKLSKSIEIHRTARDVWPWLSEPEKMKQWMKGLLEVTPLSEGEPQVGFRAKLRIKEGGRISEYDEEIVELVPNRKVRSRITGGALPNGMEMVVGWDIEDLGGRCVVTGSNHAETKGVAMKIFGPLMRLFAGLQLRSFLKRLKRLAEEA
jgi:carbon monoxide dehydrogenase subunit G